MLGIPALVPVFIAAAAVASERQQGTLEPVLTTPITREEFLLGKALASVIPSLAVAYVLYRAFLVLVTVLAAADHRGRVDPGPGPARPGVFTPLLAVWTIWVGMAVSTRSSDVRVAQQIGALVSLPPVFVVVLIALNVIPLSARPRGRRGRGPDRRRCPRLADRVPAVRPREADHRHEVTGVGPGPPAQSAGDARAFTG